MKLIRFTDDTTIEYNRNGGLNDTNFTSDEKVKMLHRIIMDKRLKSMEIRVYSYLLSHKNRSTLTQEMIAEDLETSRVTVNRSLGRLKEIGYINILVKRVEGEKQKTQAIYTINKNPGLIDTTKKLASYIDEIIIGENTSLQTRIIDRDDIENFVYRNYLDDNNEPFDYLKKFGFPEEIYEGNPYKITQGDSDEDKDIKNAYRILIFGAYIEANFGVKYKTVDFIKNAIIDMDRYVRRVDTMVLYILTAIYRDKLLERKYSMYEALTLLGVRHVYVTGKKATIVGFLEEAKEELEYHIKCMDRKEYIGKYEFPEALYKKVYNLCLTTEEAKMKFDKDLDEVTFNLEDILLMTMMCNKKTFTLFEENYNMLLQKTICIIFNNDRLFKEYIQWCHFKTSEYRYTGILLDCPIGTKENSAN